MKQFGNLKTLLTAGVAVAALSTFSSLQAQDMQQGKGVVRKITGSAQYQTGGGVWMPVSKGTSLPPGSAIKTERETIVDVYLGAQNGPTLRVTGETTVSIDTLNYTGSGEDAVSETKLNLQDGRILGSVRKLGQASKYEIKTPTGVAGIRGTDYDISTRKNAAGNYESIYIAVNGTIVGADTFNGTTTSFVANTPPGTDPQGFKSGNPNPGPASGFGLPIIPGPGPGPGPSPSPGPGPGTQGPTTLQNPTVIFVSTHA
jgi:hypothetical protein